MSTSAIVMMIMGCGIVWGGTLVSIVIALSVEKKNNLKKLKETELIEKLLI